MSTWHVTVVYDADGTQTREFAGVKVSAQVFPDGRGLVQIRDDAGLLVEAFHVARVWSIHRKLGPQRSAEGAQNQTGDQP